jgi:hypothetical protein
VKIKNLLSAAIGFVCGTGLSAEQQNILKLSGGDYLPLKAGITSVPV